jgi:large subunit ribosomal protein L15
VELLDLSNLRPAKGARRARKRIGRGPGSGTGKTAGKGHKGKGARSGGNTPPGYDGGQMPLQRRLPKRGFRSPNRRRYAIVKIAQLERFESGSVVDADALAAAGVVRRRRPIKLLGDETRLTRALTIKVDKASQSARDQVAAAGGTLEASEDASADDDVSPAKGKSKASTDADGVRE